jgi:hypothetical protein
MARARLLLLVFGCLGSAACTRTFAREAVQPNPLVAPTETLRTSQKITIVTGDMDLDIPESNGCGGSSNCNATTYHNKHYPLYNEASFTMVSRDRLRFHVQVDHKWEEYVDLKTWDVELEDDQGHTWRPESVEHLRHHLITTMWDHEQRTTVCDRSGRNAGGDCFNSIGYQDDGWRRRQPLGSLSVFRGNGDFVFYQRNLFSTSVKWMRLTVKRSGQAFEFLWRFEDNIASE